MNGYRNVLIINFSFKVKCFRKTKTIIIWKIQVYIYIWKWYDICIIAWDGATIKISKLNGKFLL